MGGRTAGGTNADGTPTGNNQAPPPSPDDSTQGRGTSTDGGVYAGTTFDGAANNGEWLKTADPRDFMYGRDPNYATNTASAERGVAADTQAQLTGQAANANLVGAAMGQQMTDYGTTAGQQIGAYGQQVGSTLGGMAQTAFGQGAALQNRQGPLADYQGANSVYQLAKNDASQLRTLEAQQGPSAAQAQLQSGLNAAQASNLALARSGHGFGMSAAALSQASAQNAAAGQNAANASAQLRSNEDAAWRQRQAANLQGAAGISSGVGGAQQQQALSQAQLQAQTMAQNDQAQAALMGQGLQAYGQAGQLGLSGLTSGAATTQAGLTSGAATTQAGQTLDLQGTQAAMGAYTQGEQMAGINVSAQQQADLARESGLIQNRGIDAGVAAGNAAAVNSGWGTALSTAAAIGGAAVSDANAKQGIKPLDSFGGMGAPPPGKPLGAPPKPVDPAATAPPPQPPPKSVSPAYQTAGAIAGGAIGTAIAPGIGTAIGGIAGSALGKIAGGLFSSDINTKADFEPLDPPSGPMGYGQTDPGGSLRAGASNAFSSGRDAAAKAELGAADADLKEQAKTAAVRSMMLGSAAKSLGEFGSDSGEGELQRFSAMGRPQQAYGMQQPGWGQMQPGVLTSDEHSKTAIRSLAKENRALKAQLDPESGPTPEMLQQAAADQDAYFQRLRYSPAVNGSGPTASQLNQAAADQDSPGLRISYPASSSPPSADMLRQAAADQDTSPVPYTRVASYTSDENEKTGVHQSDALDMVDAAPGYSYEYKDPARHGYGQKFGPMAQDLLKTPAGASTVERSPDGTLAVNTGRLALVEHAAMHSMHRENQQKFESLKTDIDALRAGRR